MTIVRRVVCAALVFYALGLLALALLPWAPDALEWVVAVVTGLAVPGLLGLGLGLPVPGRRWAYLATGGAGLVTLTAYLLASRDDWYPALPIALLLVSGIVGAYGAHLARGLQP